MRRILFFILILALLLFFLKNKKETKQSQKIIPTSTITKLKTSQSIFVPHWNLNQNLANLEQYDKLFYFGVAATTSGINEEEQGYERLADFLASVPADKKKYLTLRMLDSQTNISTLSDAKIQDKIISQTLDIAKNDGFDGVALDLEIDSLLSNNLKGQINDFVQQFYLKSKLKNLKFYVILYGDTIYRHRLYDVSTIAAHSDGILIMAYDFHKSISEPGPLFPFSGRQKYGYDFQGMIDDYLSLVPRQKITVIFGLFGYDWTVDEKKRPISRAKALNLLEIRKQFLQKCEWKDCLVKRDSRSKETEVDYINSQVVDNYGYIEYHIVWFEDEESVNIKKDYLKTRGVGDIAYWAYGYF